MKSRIPGAKVLLMGGTGTGKTYVIRTLIEAGITPFVIFTEPGMESLSDLDSHPYHWTYIPPVTSDWSTLEAIGKTVNSVTWEALSKMTDANRKKYGQWLDVIQANNDFVCDECGEHFGDVQSWGTDRALVMDSLTGFSQMAFRLHIGGKIAKSMPEYQVAQEMVMRVLDAWTTSTRCWFVMTAHEEREADMETGAIKRMPSSVGKAIAPQIPRFFSDVIECVRTGTKFSWDTATVGADTKARNVPVSSTLPPSFVPLVEAWKAKGGVIEAPAETAET